MTSCIARTRQKAAEIIVIGTMAALFIVDRVPAADLPVIDVAPADAPLLDVFVGTSFDYSPDYEGSDSYEPSYYFPEVTLSWREQVEISYSNEIPPETPDIDSIEARVIFPDIGLFWLGSIELAYGDRSEVIFVDNDRYLLGIGLDEQDGRDEDDSDSLDGLGDIDSSFVGVAFGGITLSDIDYELEFTGDLGNEINGYTIDFIVGTDFAWWDDDLEIDVDTTLTWASENYTDTFFGISADQAADSGLTALDANTGFKSVGADFELAYFIGDHWEFGIDLGYARLLGDAANSDIVAVEGSPNQFDAALSLTRRFALWN